ncbi:MAG: hypothetical protein ACRD9L_06310 [Bryobacteraceae bacterium]
MHRALMDLDRAYHRALKGLESAQARRAQVSAPVESQPSPEPVAVSPNPVRHTVARVNRALNQSRRSAVPGESRVAPRASPDHSTADKGAAAPPGPSHAH